MHSHFLTDVYKQTLLITKIKQDLRSKELFNWDYT